MYDFKRDIVFKFFLSNENDTDSRALLSCLIDGTLGRNVAIENYLQDDPKDKSVRYDIKIKDVLGNHIDIEMQNSSLSNTLVRRFVFYGSKHIGEDIHVGDKYDDMKEDESILIGKYDPRTPLGNRDGKDMGDEDILLMRYYIYLSYINVIANEKGLRNMSDYELLLYMIENGMEEVESMKDREIVKMLKRKYPQEDFEWMKECDDNIIKEIEELIYQPINYEEFYQSIHKNMN